MSFTLLSHDELTGYAPSLIPRVIKHADRFWYVKHKPGSHDEDKRDLLTYLLGKDICNIAEVKLLTEIEHNDVKTILQLPSDSNNRNTFLVRLASTYTLDDLPNKDIEKAVATELVYSVWIRRRDTHVDNRAYISGVPIFFDHQTAFLSEPHFAHSTIFFMHAPDHGHAPFWRVKQIPQTTVMTTEQARNVSTLTDKAHHYVYDLNKFKQEIRLAETKVGELATSNLDPLLTEAGFTNGEAEMIKDFLKKNLTSLRDDIEHMERIIFQ